MRRFVMPVKKRGANFATNNHDHQPRNTENSKQDQNSNTSVLHSGFLYEYHRDN